jgi:nitrogen fixation NifU-like protein
MSTIKQSYRPLDFMRAARKRTSSWSEARGWVLTWRAKADSSALRFSERQVYFIGCLARVIRLLINFARNVSRSWHDTILGMYSRELLDHFEHPRNAGEIVDSDVTVQVENPACGDILKLSLKIAEGRIAEIRFLAKGCVPAMACGSALTELVRGKTIEAASTLRREELVQAVGGLPETSIHASHLAMDALATALKQVKI